MSCVYDLGNVFYGKVINRPSKVCKSPYLADICVYQNSNFNDNEIIDNNVMAHCPGLGCGGLIVSGSQILVTEAKNEKSKSKYVIHLSKITDPDIYVGVNPNIANNIIENILLAGLIKEEWKSCPIQREQTIGNSRIDFKIDNNYLEVKNVSLAYYEDCEGKIYKKKDFSNCDCNHKISIFPDCNRKMQKKPVSERAIKHLDELIQIKNNGQNSYLVFLVQRNDCKYFTPSQLDPFYLEKCKEATHKGVIIKAISIRWDNGKAYFNKFLDLII